MDGVKRGTLGSEGQVRGGKVAATLPPLLLSSLECSGPGLTGARERGRVRAMPTGQPNRQRETRGLLGI